MRYFKVIYDFAASEPVELSVRKGEVVTCSEVVEKDGWIKVEIATDTRRKGFVPISYLKEQPQAQPSTPPVPPQAHGTPNRMTSSTPIHTDSMANNTYTGNANTTIVSTNPTGSYGGGAMTVSSASVAPAEYAANPAAVVDAFMKNEVFFKQLMKQRQEALSKMEAALADASNDVASCKDKNAILARKLRDLDQQTEKERRKWKERVDEEKLSIQRAAASAASLYGPAVESRTVRITDTYSERQSVRN